MVLLQEFDFEIQHRLGTQHAVVHYLSRIDNRDKAVEGDDDFTNGGISRISTSDPTEENSSRDDKWLLDMSLFLSTSLPLPHMRTN